MNNGFYNDFIDAVVDELGARFTCLKSCAAHDGRFSLDELGSRAMQAPAFRVALFAAKAAAGGAADLSLSLAIITADNIRGGESRFESANRLVCAAQKHILGTSWGGLAAVTDEVKGQNLYSGKLQGKKIQLWEVTWDQKIYLPADHKICQQ